MVDRRLGNSGLHVSALGLGGWLTGHVDNEIAYQCMKQAYDCGINFFDTAESYAGGQSEVIMGEAIKRFAWKRSDIVISTKASSPISAAAQWLTRSAQLGSGEWRDPHQQPRAISQAYPRGHSSVAGTASAGIRGYHIYAHRPDRLTPMEETVRAFNFIIEKGWALYWGTSEWSADEIAEACGIAKSLGLISPIVEQPLYNMLDREKVEGQYQRLYSRFGIGLTAFSPLKMGLLSGKYNNASAPPPGSRFAESKDEFARGARDTWVSEQWTGTVKRITGLQAIADKLEVKLPQLALAWCLKNVNVPSVITGASRPEQVVDNVKSLELLPKLTPEVMDEVDDYLGNSPAQDPARQD